MKYYSAKTVKQMLGVTAQTLRNWDKSGKLKPSYVKNNGYRYYSEDLIKQFTNTIKVKRELKVIGYVRVYDNDKNEELESQIKYVSNYIKNKYHNFEIITDIGSSFNTINVGLRKLIEKINNKEVDIIVASYKDRLSRYGFELIEYFASINNVKIEIIDKLDKSEDQELIEDLLKVTKNILYNINAKKHRNIKALIENFENEINKNRKQNRSF